MANNMQLSFQFNPSVQLSPHPSKSFAGSSRPFFSNTHFRISTLRLKKPQEFAMKVSRGGEEGDSYLHMWKRAVERSEMEKEEERRRNEVPQESGEGIEKKNERFMKILDVSGEERDKIQRLQMIDRAAAAIAAARAILSEKPARTPDSEQPGAISVTVSKEEEGVPSETSSTFVHNVPKSETSTNKAPGPDFWSWSPPTDVETVFDGTQRLQPARKHSFAADPIAPVLEKDRVMNLLPIPFESNIVERVQAKHDPPLPPLQSLVEVDRVNGAEKSFEFPSFSEEESVHLEFSTASAEAASVLGDHEEKSSYGEYEDGSRWWRETGVETRSDGVVCRWTVVRGISAKEDVEWEEKYWEASDQFDYKELGSEKSGRDATGNVWREYWRESMWQDLNTGAVNIEKTADKWGKNGKNEEWQEKWWEHYDDSGHAEKWAHKWCCIDPSTPLEVGHAHVWHERWGEKYNGKGSSMKYTDKWAERSENDSWTKWGDKWDESFDENGHGVKQGETWWQGVHGERWNRTWGEGHNGSGWVHKYGKSSSGEHWDTHVQQDTWYERQPHYGFFHCYENSKQLQEVKKPRRTEL